MGFCLPAPVTAQDLQGFQYFRLLGPLFDHLHTAGTERDRAGNRQLFYDQYATLLLLYFFNPTVTSLRGRQQTTTLAQVQARFGIRRTSLGALSEAASVFDAALLHAVLTALGAQLRPSLSVERALRERMRLAALGAEVGVALTQEETLPNMLRRCAEAVVHYLNAALARVWTLHRRENVLELQASAGLDMHLDSSHSRIPVGQLTIGRIAQERQPHLTNAVIGDPRVDDQEWARREGMVAFAGYPLAVGHRLSCVACCPARSTTLACSSVRCWTNPGGGKRHNDPHPRHRR
jgi:hypothetical protein